MVLIGFSPPKFWGGGRDLSMVLLSFYEGRLSGGDTKRWWGHSNVSANIKFELFALTDGGDAKILLLVLSCPHSFVLSVTEFCYH